MNQSAEAMAGKAVILLVEDNKVNRWITQRLLEKLGYKVIAADNGKAALAILESTVIDLILMDCEMPELDGFETTALIRERERASGSRVPIIAMTGDATETCRKRCEQTGMDGYLAKPVTLQMLKDTIEEYFR